MQGLSKAINIKSPPQRVWNKTIEEKIVLGSKFVWNQEEVVSDQEVIVRAQVEIIWNVKEIAWEQEEIYGTRKVSGNKRRMQGTRRRLSWNERRFMESEGDCQDLCTAICSPTPEQITPVKLISSQKPNNLILTW